MGQDRNIRALIVGGGVGGLTAAVALRHAGIEAKVFERGTQWNRLQVGGGLHLWNNAMLGLQKIDLEDDVIAAGSVVDRVELCSYRGTQLGEWPAGEWGKELGAPTVGISRSDLQRVLRNKLGDDAVELGAECTGFTQDDSGVAVQFADGREERGDVLIGADGIESVIRAQMFGKTSPRFAGYAVWQAIIDYEHKAAPLGLFRVTWGPGRRFAFYHVGGERLFWFVVQNVQAGGKEVNKQELQKHFRKWPEPAPSVIDATDASAIIRGDQRDIQPLAHWGEGRVTLLGDAAHAMTFNVGQGACQAVEDAVVLARRLGQANDVVSALRSYEAARMSRTADIQNQAWRLGSIGRWSNPALVLVRDRLFKRNLSGSFVKEMATYQF